jgi:hypothetical protein
LASCDCVVAFLKRFFAARSKKKNLGKNCDRDRVPGVFLGGYVGIFVIGLTGSFTGSFCFVLGSFQGGFMGSFPQQFCGHFSS